MKRFSVEDLWKLKRPAGVSLSADGSRAVVSLTSYSMKENRASASLWLLSTSGGKPRVLTTCGEKDGQPAWSPDGSSIAFVARREWQGKKDEEPQVYLIAPDGGEARRLTQLATGVSGVKWFPDGKRVAFFSWVWPELRGAAAQARRMKERKEDKVKAHVVEQYTYRFWDHWLADGRVPHLFVADVSTGACRDLFEGTPYELVRADPDQHVFDVSPDGRFIAFGYDPAPEKKLDDEFDLVELEVKARRFRNLTQGEPHRDYHHPRYSPDGTRIACLSADIRRNPRAQNQITLIARRTRRIEIVSRRWDRWVEAPLRWSGDGKEILCVAQDQARAHLYRFDLPARSAQIAVTGGVVMEFDFAGGTTAYVRSEMDTPPAVYAGAVSNADCFPGFQIDNNLDFLDPSVVSRIWASNRVTAPTHYDMSDNIACVISGHRRFTFFPPDQLPNLYVGPLEFTPAGQPTSMVNLAAPDLGRYPRFSEALAAAQVAELEPGDAVFIPNLWWHNVESLDPFNILVNYWWFNGTRGTGSPFAALVYGVLAISDLPESRRQAWRQMFDHYVFQAKGEPVPHLAPEHRGILGRMSPELAARIRAWLLNALQKG